MSVYAIGDIQGCCTHFRRILDEVRFDPSNDKVLLVGDLVNRGPHSLDTLRLVLELGESVQTVLGNHDLNTLAVAEGIREDRPRDTIREILDAPDAHELLTWLRHQPLLIDDPFGIIVHAGIYPL